jgi:hypothetical protein
MNSKKRIFRLIEIYLNEFRGPAVEEVYGKGTKIKIHSISESVKEKLLLIESVVILGETINENVIDETLANIIIQDAIVYFFPRHQVKTLIRWDV